MKLSPQYAWFCCAAVLLLALPGCIKSTKPIDKTIEHRSLYDAMKSEYQPIITNVQRLQQAKDAIDTKETMRETREHILIKADQYTREIKKSWMPYDQYQNYPYHRYVATLDENVSKLTKMYDKQPWKNDPFGQQVKTLLDQIEMVRRHVITRNEYLREKRLMEMSKKGIEEAPTTRLWGAAGE